ncbi:hypothetical protein N7451_012347 [Penicillium sp. IBT 35674x]|nr:hypothetical protein N7451_012347 [Penicillium sp. IBT 35674x]
MYAARQNEFERQPSTRQKRQAQAHIEWSGPPSKVIYAGVSISEPTSDTTIISISVRDVVYPLDYVQKQLQFSSQKADAAITHYIMDALRQYSEEHFEKFIGVGLPAELSNACPRLTSRLWLELDIIPLVVSGEKMETEGDQDISWEQRALDEQAELLAMKCVRVRLFGPQNVPLLQVGYRGLVEVDSDFHMHIASLEDYRDTVSSQTWDMLQLLASRIRSKKIAIALFSATPQGGGVALMRHAFVRLGRLLDLEVKWYVPQPRSGVFRVTKMNHNILQGVSQEGDYLSKQDEDLLREWTTENSDRYWGCDGGPLDRPSNGGADIIMVDDPQMPDLIQIAKEKAPDRPIIYRSHIQIRADLASESGTPQARSWNWLWERAQQAEIFISHPIPESVPRDVPEKMVGYMPASTDMLDGLNKDMRDWDTAHYGRVFNQWCQESGMPMVDYPSEEYLTQIARFDPSKGFFDVLSGYSMFHDRMQEAQPNAKVPKLVICGHGSVDDPDATETYDAVVNQIEEKMPHLRDHICVVRAKPSDQVLNAVLSKAKIVLQLSTCEGFEIKVSEALRKGKPVIATNVGGLPYQIKDGESGFLIEPHDPQNVAQRLWELWNDEDLFNRLHDRAIKAPRDEVTTVGHLASWLYLVEKLVENKAWKPQNQLLYNVMSDELLAGQN